MFTQDFAGWSSLGKTFFEPLYDAQRVTMPFIEKITRESISFVTDNVASNVKFLQTLNKSSKFEDLLSSQLICLTEQGEKNLQHAQQFLKIGEEGLREFRRIATDKMTQIFSEGEQRSKKSEKMEH